jgi:hypothetical protein
MLPSAPPGAIGGSLDEIRDTEIGDMLKEIRDM